MSYTILHILFPEVLKWRLSFSDAALFPAKGSDKESNLNLQRNQKLLRNPTDDGCFQK